MAGNSSPHSEIPAERRFVWRNLDAFLSGELNDADRERIESFLCDCPETKQYVENEQQFAAAIQSCLDRPSVNCPDGLKERVMLALQSAEAVEEAEDLEADDDEEEAGHPGAVLRFPWLGAVMMAAASIMLVVSLIFLASGGEDPEIPDLPHGLSPMVAQIEMDCPVSSETLYADAEKVYRQHFADGPDLPTHLNGEPLKISHFECVPWQGAHIMCAVYDTADGQRFGLMVFCRDCAREYVPEEMHAAEVTVDGRSVVMWREGGYYKALVGDDEGRLREHMSELRRTA